MENNLKNSEKNNIENNILEKIKSGQVKMTSKKFFILKWTTLFVTSLFFLIFAIYIFAYIVFLFVDNGLMVIPFNTETGILKFIIEIPWTLVFLGLLSVFLFSITSKNFYKIYKKPFLTFFFSILMIIVISHLILLQTGTLKALKEEAYKLNIKLAPNKLLQFRNSQTGNLFVGKLYGTTTDSILIIDRQNNVTELFVENGKYLNDFLLGTRVNAYGIRVQGNVILKSIVNID